MFIERPPALFRALFPGAVFRLPTAGGPTVYLTFDDGPVPEVTPWVLDTLDSYGVKATFFMVGDNVRRHPELMREVASRGHALGNHTMHHLHGGKVTDEEYLADAAAADEMIGSPLFRPPHGWLTRSRMRGIKEAYTLVMYDFVTRDYSRRLTPAQVLANVRRYARNGSIIVFHDSLKSRPRLVEALPGSIEWLKDRGYRFATLDKETIEKTLKR